MKRLILTGMMIMTAAPATAWCQDYPGEQPEAAGVQRPVLNTTAEQRDWLREQLVQGLENPGEIRHIQRRLSRMTPLQINALTNVALAQRFPRGQAEEMLEQAQFELQRAIWLRQMLENDLWWRRYNAVGYMPVITWLPQGTHFGASAVVSPDRRYVRVSPNPVFSSVGPVYSYNLNTGQTRRLPQYDQGTPPYMYRPPQEGYRAGQIPNLPEPPRATPTRPFTDSYWGRRR
jgi:hypothetical protein